MDTDFNNSKLWQQQADVSITFSCPLETLPLSFSVFAVRFCNCVVLCCEIDEDVYLLCLCFVHLHVFS